MELGLSIVVLDCAQIEDVEVGADGAKTADRSETTHPMEESEETHARAKPRKRRLLVGRDRWTKHVMARDDRQARDTVREARAHRCLGEDCGEPRPRNHCRKSACIRSPGERRR